MEFIVELLATIFIEILYMTILNSIGAAIRSIFVREKTIEELMDQNPFMNFVVAIACITILVLLLIKAF